jgi:hypothetical protein
MTLPGIHTHRHFILTGWGPIEECGRRSVRGHERRYCWCHEWAVRWWMKWRLPPGRPSQLLCSQGSPAEKTSHILREMGTPWSVSVKPSNEIQWHGRRLKLSYSLATNLTIYLLIYSSIHSLFINKFSLILYLFIYLRLLSQGTGISSPGCKITKE